MENFENNQSTGMAKTALTYGIVIGIMLILIQLVFYFAHNITSPLSSILSYVIMLGGIVVVVRYRRDNDLGGYIKYGQALGLGTFTIFIASLLLGIYVYTFYKFIDPAAINLILKAAENKMLKENSNISDEQLDAILKAIRHLMNPGFIAFSNLFNFTFLGFVLSLMVSIFLKKSPPEEI